jgi:hypothetical protein
MPAIIDGSNGITNASWTTAARPASPATGQMGFNSTTGQLDVYISGAWANVTTNKTTGSVLQVVSATKTDTFSSSTTSFVDVTGLSVSITPTSSSSKILIFYNVHTSASQNSGSAPLRLLRNSTAIDIGDAASTRPRVSSIFYSGDVTAIAQSSIGSSSNTFLDSPATTSSVTYKIQMLASTGGVTMYVNRSASDRDTTTYDARAASSITVMEIAG